jgi:hypothetical protein
MNLPIQKNPAASEEEFQPVGAFAFFLSLLVFFAGIWISMYAWMLSRVFH